MRRSRLAQFDDQFRARWGDCLAGVDEAGRGPLAGPVVAACVALPPDVTLRGVRDSKEMTAPERETALEKIRAVAIATGVGVASVTEVDAFNIRMATLLAMRRAVEALGMTPQGFLVDGDAKSLSVAAASIVAKVTRDRMMDECAAAYPVYRFAENKGYGTPDHLEALREHGPCELHRRSFRPVRELLCVQEVIELF